MTAERLREAAAVLREVAEGATPGPWWASPEYVFPTGESTSAIASTGDNHTDEVDPDACYIATMSPPVALAVAEWLDMTAQSFGTPGHRNWHGPEVRAVAAADAVLGNMKAASS